MEVTCACGVSEDHASPGCAEHERRSAELTHLHHTANGLSGERCPVCAAPAPANRRARRGVASARALPPPRPCARSPP